MAKILLINPKDDKVGQVYDPLVELRHKERELEDEIFKEDMKEYFAKREIQTHFRDYPYITNLGLLSIAAYCREHGAHNVKKVQDGEASREELSNYIKEADLVGISVKTINRKRSKLLGEFVKYINKDAILVAGGPEVTLCGMDGPFDVFIRGAGEQVISDLATFGRDILPECKGVKYKNKLGEYVDNPGVNVMDIKSVPLPAYDLVKNIEKSQVYFEVARGCNFCCSFCVEHAPIQVKSYEQIKENLKAIEKIRQHSTIHIIDSDFMTPEGGSDLFFKAVEEVKPTNHFIVQTRAKHLNKEMVQKMYSHNIIDLYLGIESLSDNILKTVRKGINYEEIKNALTILRENAPTPVAYRGNFIQGLPGENAVTSQEDYNRREEILKADLLRIMRDYVFMPLEGSHIYQNQERYGIKLPQEYKPSFRNSLPQHSYENWTQEDIYRHQEEMIRLKLNYLEKLKTKEGDIRIEKEGGIDDR